MSMVVSMLEYGHVVMSDGETYVPIWRDRDPVTYQLVISGVGME